MDDRGPQPFWLAGPVDVGSVPADIDPAPRRDVHSLDGLGADHLFDLLADRLEAEIFDAGIDRS